ncbi:MAG: SsrA-binding protein SmpB [candidate division Zixibacteria bacterium]|nr:SsrA-binding protein SmpB [candidate division Zixibacteria bacterium]
MNELEKKIKVITTNRKAFHEYYISDRFEAGLSLVGTEVKSLRDGKVQMSDAYVVIENGEAFLVNLHINQYKMSHLDNHEPARKRRLLLNKREIGKLRRASLEKGYTIVPLKIYFKGPYAKVEIGMARGKRQYDKRESIAKRESDRDIARKMRDRNR